MIKHSNIPPEVVEAAQEAFWDASGTANDCLVHAIAAALNAWPGVVVNYSWDGSHGRIVLPQKESSE